MLSFKMFRFLCMMRFQRFVGSGNTLSQTKVELETGSAETEVVHKRSLFRVQGLGFYMLVCN